MWTFLLLVLAFSVVIIVLDQWVLKTRLLMERKTRKVALIMVVMTAIFDNVLTYLPAYNFNHSKTLGIYFFKAPLEDFLYIAMVTLMVGMLSKYAKQKFND